MKNIRRIIGVLLVIIGLSIIVSVVYKKVVTNQKQQQLIDIFEGELTGEKVEGQSTEDINLEEVNGYKPIAIIEIPRIKLKQAVVDGISDNVLQHFLGKFEDSVMPGEVGNFSVAGHRVSDYTDAFINLYKVKQGDEVIVRTKDMKYTYEIDNNFIVNPEDVEVLNDSDYEKITLITCTVGAKQRVIVTGKLIKSEKINN